MVMYSAVFCIHAFLLHACKQGQYRLNFSGRVQTPSVKNMQLENEQGEILLQFGKVDEHRFHLDYKAPFTAFSAFGAALCQFDL
jgi:tubby-related protein 1